MISHAIRPTTRCANRACLAEVPGDRECCPTCWPRLPYSIASTIESKRSRGALDVAYSLAVRNARNWLERLSAPISSRQQLTPTQP